MEDVRVQFGGLVAVDNVSFSVNAGDVLGVIGPNGAGKTTCFNALTGMAKVQSGVVRLFGEEITNLAPDKIARRGMGRTFQLVRLFRSMSVLENVLVGALIAERRQREARRRALECIERVGLGPHATARVGALPLADQKKAEIARALAGEPRVLLLDEMMNGLTGEETRHLVDLVASLGAGGLTVVVVEHVLPVIRTLCNRVVVFDGGRLIAGGTPSECLANPDVVTAYLGTTSASTGSRRRQREVAR